MFQTHRMSVALFLLVIFEAIYFFKPVLFAKIAAYPMPAGSQYLMMRNVGLELANRGHQFVIITSSTHSVQPSDKIQHRVYQVPFTRNAQDEVMMNSSTGWSGAMKLAAYLKTICESTLNETSLREEFKDFDLMLTDSTMPCGVILAQWFGIPWVEICPMGPQMPILHYYNMPMPVAYIPQFNSGNTGKMTFLQRIKNAFVPILGNFGLNVVFIKPLADLKVKYDVKPEQSIYEALGDAELVLLTADFALEYAQPMLPSTKMVGCLNIQKAQPLASKLEEFMASSGEHGVLLVSFGTNVAALEEEKMKMFAEAFGKLKQKVIWKMRGYSAATLSPNIKIMEWLPQTDLLAHKKLKAFMTHVGHNSLYEAAYYGVPMVMIPLFADQFNNALKGWDRGLGFVVDHNTITADQLQKAIETVIHEPRFKADAERVSRIMRDRTRTPQEEAADWIEYVIRHGGARHLRPEVFNMTWYQYYLVDVAVFLAGILCAVFMVTRLVCSCLFCRSSSNNKKE